MHFLGAITSTLLLAGSAVAQMSGAASGSSAAGSTTTVHVVSVSNSTGTKLQFSPNNVQAKMGDMVQFQFLGGNHTVTQSTFAQPCIPINNVMSNTTGFFSGFQPVAATAQQFPTYTMVVNTTSPIWFYCSQKKHCQAGMVGAINAASTGAKTVQAFAQLAANATQNLAPGSASSGSSSGSGGSSSGSGSSNSTGSGSGSSGSGSGPAPAAGSSAPAVSTGGASGSVWASTKDLYMGASLAGLVAAGMMML